jgi:hypothetical protein
MGPKPVGEKYAARYSAVLKDGRVWFSGGGSDHSVNASIPLKDINAHWKGYCGQGRYQAVPKPISRKVWETATASKASVSA